MSSSGVSGQSNEIGEEGASEWIEREDREERSCEKEDQSHSIQANLKLL